MGRRPAPLPGRREEFIWHLPGKIWWLSAYAVCSVCAGGRCENGTFCKWRAVSFFVGVLLAVYSLKDLYGIIELRAMLSAVILFFCHSKAGYSLAGRRHTRTGRGFFCQRGCTRTCQGPLAGRLFRCLSPGCPRVLKMRWKKKGCRKNG